MNPPRGPKPKRPAPAIIIVEGQECTGVPLTKGMTAIVDKADAESVLRFFWFAKKHGTGPNVIWYASRRVRVGEPLFGVCQMVPLHKFLLANASDVDHINGNGLDCRRCNLRSATKSQNMGNCRLSAASKTGFKGVTFRPAKGNRRGRWCARISTDGKRVTLGSFQDPIEAAKAYNEAALQKWGAFARLNTIPIQSPNHETHTRTRSAHAGSTERDATPA